MRTSARAIAIAFAVGACFAPFGARAFVSGSTGADGDFNPPVNVTIDVPAVGGTFNYGSVNIPVGVTVTYRRNTANTPLVILATGNVTIAGTLNVSGTTAPGVGAAGGGAIGDDGTPGSGGPGGFDGGRGGKAGVRGFGGTGLGSGAGNPGFFVSPDTCIDGNGWASGGTGGGFGAGAGASPRTSFNCTTANPPYNHTQALGGSAYGSSRLLPLIGGSGGGGGGGGITFDGGGGGGGGGAILIAASGTVNVTGSLLANGGAGGAGSGAGIGGAGGGGSGGAIRVIATTLAGNGTISAAAGAAGTIAGQSHTVYAASAGAQGYVRLEAETITRTAASSPIATSDLPGPVFVAGTPTLRIASVAGVSAPALPTGNADITLPSSTPNPVAVVFETSGVPVGNTVLLTVTPAFGAKTTAITPALTGSTASATASVSVSLPVGPSVLSAQTTYTVVAALGDLLRNFAGNERVEKVTLTATFGGPSKAKLITVSGKEYEVSADVLRIAALGG